MSDVKLCKDCRWMCRIYNDETPYGCENPAVAQAAKSYVTGIVLCRSARCYDTPCGPEGAQWEPRPPRWWQFWRRRET
jgi:hypothetical protein